MSSGQANSAALRGPSIVGSISDLDPVIDRAHGYEERLAKIADRLCGPRPEEVRQGVDGKSGAIPVSVIASINERRSRIVDILDGIERSLQTIENVL